ncbi:MAG: hypothetical protein MUE76_08685 [Syntrophales bacterium]|nr:hypothetical protein [Syntrophales bacterium]
MKQKGRPRQGDGLSITRKAAGLLEAALEEPGDGLLPVFFQEARSRAREVDVGDDGVLAGGPVRAVPCEPAVSLLVKDEQGLVAELVRIVGLVV